MTALIVISSIFIVLVLLLYPSLTVYVKIVDDVYIKVGAYGIKIAVLPASQKPKKQKRKKKTATQEEKSPAKPKKQVNETTFGETVSLVLTAIKSVLKPTTKLLSRIRLTCVKINIAVCDDDADETAIKFGGVTTAIYSVLGYLNQLIKVRIERVDIRPDFVGDQDRYYITFKVKLRLYQILGAAFRILFSLVVNIIKRQVKSSKSEQTNKSAV